MHIRLSNVASGNIIINILLPFLFTPSMSDARPTDDKISALVKFARYDPDLLGLIKNDVDTAYSEQVTHFLSGILSSKTFLEDGSTGKRNRN